jgi:DNA repair protein RAD5
MIMSLEIFLLSSAFISPNQKGTQKQTSSFGFQQGQESLDERILRERKGALLKLFTALSLQPKQGVDEAGFRRTQQTARANKRNPKKTRKKAKYCQKIS